MTARIPRDLDEAAFRAAWLDPSLRREDVARMFGMTVEPMRGLVRKLGLPPKQPGTHTGTRPNAATVDRGALLAVRATIEDAQDWLYAQLLRDGHKHDAAMERIGIFTPRGLVAECNTLRVRAGLSPYRVEVPA